MHRLNGHFSHSHCGSIESEGAEPDNERTSIYIEVATVMRNVVSTHRCDHRNGIRRGVVRNKKCFGKSMTLAAAGIAVHVHVPPKAKIVDCKSGRFENVYPINLNVRK